MFLIEQVLQLEHVHVVYHSLSSDVYVPYLIE